MLFNSLQFLVFFPAVTALYFILPHRFRAFWLLAASCVFYTVFIPLYLLLLFFMIGVDYASGILIERASGDRKKVFLILSLVSNAGILCFFKYYNFFAANLNHLAVWTHWDYSIPLLALVLPLGLSFHTFQAMSYNIEVYRGRQKAEKNFGIFALYVMFYPQLVAGPIERPNQLIPQFYEKHSFDYKRVTDGLKLMLWGLFKKIVIADQAALAVDAVYGHPAGHTGPVLALATVLFAFQIYCDFSGYSDIAVGAAQVMGFRLMNNFRRPYFSKSVREFWTRWHISLSSWFKDYVYLPLGGRQVSKRRWYLNLMIVFLISGFWHGAKWTFVLWGALNGFYILFSIATEGARQTFCRRIGLTRFTGLHQTLRAGITFLLICFSWIFFRANNLSDAGYIAGHVFQGWSGLGNPAAFFQTLSRAFSGITRPQWLLLAGSILLMESLHFFQRRGSVREMLSRQPVWVRWPLYYTLVLAVVLLGMKEPKQFIYFQF